MKYIPGKTPKKWRIAVAVIVLAGVVYFGRQLFAPHPSIAAPEDVEVAEDADIVWTCSMHPEVREPEPGPCPLCEMALIPVEADGLDLEENQVAVSEEARALAGIQVAPAERREVERRVRLYGEVDYDETRMKGVSSDVSGRIDRLNIAFTGSRIRKGDPMFQLYSPRLISAQEELLQAMRTLEAIGDTENVRRLDSARSNAEGARERLRWWGVTDEQIEHIEETGEIIDRLTIKSPLDGVVVERRKDRGDYVAEGEPVYRVADLSRVWVRLEAYESDLPWVHYGQEITFTADNALPGEEFRGRIVFVDPVLDRGRRTVRLRANVPNPDGRLRPGMFLRGVLRARLTAAGRAAKPADLAGKWISPLYPENISDEPGTCPDSGVDLVRAEDLGYAETEPENGEDPLVIPRSAPLITGQRAIVYVKVPDDELIIYEGREITLGPRAGDYYHVRDGLEEGELVVVRGNFKLDSELQLDGRPSMMSPPEEEDVIEPVWEIDEGFLEEFETVISGYLDIADALADDDFERAQNHGEKTVEIIEEIDTDPLDEMQRSAWEESAGRLGHMLHHIHHAGDMEEARTAFEEVTLALENIFDQFGMPPGVTLYRLHCPMAFGGEGADWFSDSEEVLNPYFGESMLECGGVVEKLQ